MILPPTLPIYISFPNRYSPLPHSTSSFLKQRVFSGIFSLSNTTSSHRYIGIGRRDEEDWRVIYRVFSVGYGIWMSYLVCLVHLPVGPWYSSTPVNVDSGWMIQNCRLWNQWQFLQAVWTKIGIIQRIRKHPLNHSTIHSNHLTHTSTPIWIEVVWEGWHDP